MATMPTRVDIPMRQMMNLSEESICFSPWGLVYYGQCWGHAQSYSHTLAQEVNVVSMMGTVCASGVLGVG